MDTCINVESYIRGYHEYVDIWEPKIDEKYELKREPETKKYLDAVAIVKSSRGSTETSGLSHVNAVNETVDVVGHIPKNMAPYVSKFLKRASNSASVTVKGKRINRGAGYGLEIPCV